MATAQFKECPYCREQIRMSAVKCRYCGEWLEEGHSAEVDTGSMLSARLPESAPGGMGTWERDAERLIESPAPPDENQADRSKAPSDIETRAKDVALPDSGAPSWKIKTGQDDGDQVIVKRGIPAEAVVRMILKREIKRDSLVAPEGSDEYEFAGRIPAFAAAFDKPGADYLFAKIYAVLCFFAATILGFFLVSGAVAIFMGQVWHPSPLRTAAFGFQFALYLATGLTILRRQRHAIPLAYANAVVAGLAVVLHGFIPLEILFYVPTVAIVFYLKRRRALLR